MLLLRCHDVTVSLALTAWLPLVLLLLLPPVATAVVVDGRAPPSVGRCWPPPGGYGVLPSPAAVARLSSEMECVFASGVTPSRPPLGRMKRHLAWLPDPMYPMFAAGQFGFETQCHGEAVAVAMVGIPMTKMVSVSNRMTVVPQIYEHEGPFGDGIQVADGSVRDGRGGLVLDFGFDSAGECGGEALNTKPWETHGVFPGNPNPHMARIFKDIGRIVGETADGEAILLVKSFALIDFKWHTVGWYVNTVEDRGSTASAVAALRDNQHRHPPHAAPQAVQWDYHTADTTAALIATLAATANPAGFVRWFWTGHSR